jgi:AraC-like DNA-binding protein
MDVNSGDEFNDAMQRFVGLLQVSAAHVHDGGESLEHFAQELLKALPTYHNAAEFLMLRSVLVEFAFRTLRTLSGSTDSILQLAELLPLSNQLGSIFAGCLVEGSRRATTAISDLRADRAVSLITMRCCDPTLDAASVAREVGVSQEYLAKLLHAHCGYGFLVARRRARIRIIKARLENGFERIKEIASHVGYSCSSQLDRDFRIECHITPGEYRRRHLSAARKLLV